MLTQCGLDLNVRSETKEKIHRKKKWVRYLASVLMVCGFNHKDKGNKAKINKGLHKTT